MRNQQLLFSTRCAIVIEKVWQPLKNYSKQKKPPHVLVSHISLISYLNCDMSIALVFTSSSEVSVLLFLSRVCRDFTDAHKLCKQNQLRTNKVHMQRFASPGCRILKVDVKSHGADGKPRDDCLPRADLGSVSSAGSVSPGSALPWASLCPSEMAMSPASFELPFNARFADLQTPALIHTDVDIIKRAGYFRWDESAFIHWRGEEVSALEQH